LESNGFEASVVDSQGLPVRGAQVRIRLDYDDVVSTETDNQGSARLAGLDPKKEYEIEIDAPESRDDLRPARIEMEGWKPESTEIRFKAAWRLKGHVTDLSGVPLRAARLWKKDDDGKWAEAGQTGRDERFDIGELTAGEAKLRAGGTRAPQPDAAPHAVIREGERDVVLQIDAAPEIRIRILDWPKDAYGHGRLTRADDPEAESSVYVEEDGTLRFPCLDRKCSYILWLTSTADGKILYLRDLRPGRGETRATLTESHPITGKVIFPEDYQRTSHDPMVRLSGPGLWDFAEVDGDGRFRFEEVPEGTWLLEVRSYQTGLKVERQVKAGTDVRIDLNPK
jgi:hypothetical protein